MSAEIVLTAAIAANATSMTISDASALPTLGTYTVSVEGEVFNVSSVTGKTLTVSSQGNSRAHGQNAIVNINSLPTSFLPSLINQAETLQIDARNYGAYGNTLEFSNFTTNSGSAVVSTPSYSFTNADIGKLIAINGAGAAGAMFASTIISVSGGNATCAATAGTNKAGNGLGVFGNDDYAGVQAAINAAQATDYKQGIVYLPPGNYIFSAGITIDPMMISFNGVATYLHFECMTSGAAISINQANTKRVGVWCTNALRGVQLVGPGLASNVDGISFANSNAAFSVAGYGIYDVSVYNFRYGEYFSNQTYLIHHFNFKVRSCTTGLYMPGGQSNYGENIAYHGGIIAECSVGVEDAENAYSNNFNFFGTSFDFNGIYIKVTAGQVNCYGCHFESQGSTTTDSVFQVANSNGAKLQLIGGDFFFDSTNVSGFAPFRVGASGTIVVRNMLLQNMTNGTNALCEGVGRFIIDGTHGYGTALGTSASQVPVFAASKNTTNANAMVDPSFEGGITADLISISADTVAVIDRVTGTNISLAQSGAQHNSGSFSLRATKVGAAGTAARFAIYVPIPKQSMVVGSFYYTKPGAETGSFAIETYFGVVAGFDGNGIPVRSSLNELLLSSNTVNCTASVINWTRIGYSQTETSQAPGWATHFVIRINMDSMNACNLYFDDVVVNTL
jgi:hypothetical protein